MGSGAGGGTGAAGGRGRPIRARDGSSSTARARTDGRRNINQRLSTVSGSAMYRTAVNVERASRTQSVQQRLANDASQMRRLRTLSSRSGLSMNQIIRAVQREAFRE